jgi:hypothetical protein
MSRRYFIEINRVARGEALRTVYIELPSGKFISSYGPFSEQNPQEQSELAGVEAYLAQAGYERVACIWDEVDEVDEGTSYAGLAEMRLDHTREDTTT